MIQEHMEHEESTIDHLPESCFEIKESWLIDTKKLILAGKLTLKEAYPIEVYTNPTLQKTTIDECTLQIDQHNTITLRIFLHIEAE